MRYFKAKIFYYALQNVNKSIYHLMIYFFNQRLSEDSQKWLLIRVMCFANKKWQPMISEFLVPTLCMWENGLEFLIKTLGLSNKRVSWIHFWVPLNIYIICLSCALRLLMKPRFPRSKKFSLSFIINKC